MLKKALAYSPSILAVLIALSQIAITQSGGTLSPDKGGGFGLFSTVDQLNNRALGIYGRRGPEERPLNFDFFHPALQELLPARADARAFPTTEHLETLARQLIDSGHVDGLDSIRIEVRRCVLDRTAMQVTYEKLHEVTVPVTGRSGS